MLLSHLFLCLPCLLSPFTVPWKWFWPDLMSGRRLNRCLPKTKCVTGREKKEDLTLVRLHEHCKPLVVLEKPLIVYRVLIWTLAESHSHQHQQPSWRKQFTRVIEVSVCVLPTNERGSRATRMFFLPPRLLSCCLHVYCPLIKVYYELLLRLQASIYLVRTRKGHFELK